MRGPLEGPQTCHRAYRHPKDDVGQSAMPARAAFKTMAQGEIWPNADVGCGLHLRRGEKL